MTPTKPTMGSVERTSDERNPVLFPPDALPLVLLALLVVSVAPVLRSLYSILYVVGED